MTVPVILATLAAWRFPLDDEKRLQQAIADLFTGKIEFEREVRLGDGDIIDFMVGGIGIEAKIKGQRRRIYQQCLRYLRHERVQALILVTQLAVALPSAVGAKPCHVFNLGKAWL